MATDVPGILNEIDEKQQRINSNLSAKLQALQQHNAEFDEKVFKKIQDILDLIKKANITNLTQKIKESDNKLRETKIQLVNANMNLKKANDELLKTQQELAEKTSLLGQANTALEEANKRIEKLLNEVRILNDELKELQLKLQQAQSVSGTTTVNPQGTSEQALQAEIDKCRQELESKTLELDDVLSDRNRLSNENKELTAKINDIVNKQGDLTGRLQAINAQLDGHLGLIEQIQANQPDIQSYMNILGEIETELTALNSMNTMNGGKNRRKTKKLKGGYKKTNSNRSKSNSKTKKLKK